MVGSGCRSHYGCPFSHTHLIVHHERVVVCVLPTSLSFGNYSHALFVLTQSAPCLHGYIDAGIPYGGFILSFSHSATIYSLAGLLLTLTFYSRYLFTDVCKVYPPRYIRGLQVFKGVSAYIPINQRRITPEIRTFVGNAMQSFCFVLFACE